MTEKKKLIKLNYNGKEYGKEFILLDDIHDRIEGLRKELCQCNPFNTFCKNCKIIVKWLPMVVEK